MVEEFYKIPEKPQYSIDDIRKIQNSDPVNAELILNPLILRVLENIAAVYKRSANVIVGATPPAAGPALWFCSDPAWRPETETVATAILGGPAEADRADVTGEVNGVVYPVLNAVATEEGGGIVATIKQSQASPQP